MIQVKTMTLIDGKWFVSYYCDNMCFNNTFVVCIDENLKNIEKIYIFSKEDIIEHGRGITITNNPSHSRTRWYDEFIIDEKPYNEVFHSFMSFIDGRKFLGIEDIKKWSKMVKL